MAFDFPITPAVGQLYPDPELPGLPQYRWDGSAWQAAAGTASDYVKKIGDVMVGHLGLPAGPAAEQAVRKDYVDAAIGAIPPPVAVDISGKVNRVGDTMTGVLVSAGGGELNAAGSAPSFEVRSSGGSGWAPMAFHVVGSFGANFGMLNNGNFYMGGWSHGAATYQFWTTRDFNYIPNPNLGYTPVQQSGGAYQAGNKIYIGWDGSRIRGQVDGYDQGQFWHGGSNNYSETGYQIFPHGGIIQWGSSVIALDANGQGWAYFPTVYPNQCSIAVVSNGDGNTGQYAVMSTCEKQTNAVRVKAIQSPSGIVFANSTLRFNWFSSGY